MSTITTRSGKGSPLTHAEVDANFNNLNTDKIEDGDSPSFVNVTVSGTVDGRDIAADGTKLDGIEASATADQTGAEIKAAYELEANAFTDAQFTKLAGIETAATADQTAGEIKTAYESNADTNAFTDADHTKLDGIEASATADQSAGEIKTAYESNADTNAFTDAEQTKLAGIEANATADQSAAEIKTAYESNSDTNAFTDADHTKLDGIEASADVTDTLNVTAAGALMDSEVTNLAQVKAFDSADYATAAQGTLADSALQSSDIGSTVQAFDADTLKADTADTLTAPFRGTVTADNDLSFDLNVTNNFSCTPTGAGTLIFTNHGSAAGQSGFVLLDNSGGHAIAAAATTKINAADLTAISTAGVYTLSYFDNGTNAYVSVSRSFA